jgi:polysaccharide biosynthesis protein PelG
MAGIGFELKKLFSKEGMVLNLRANLYASIVTTGSMIMGALLLFGMKYLSIRAGASYHQQDLIIVIITYSLLFSLLLSSTVSFILSRYIADMVFIKKYERILTSFYGSLSILLFFGAVGWSIFLYLSKLPFIYGFLSFLLFCEALMVWMQLNYINAVKDYQKLTLGFIFGILVALITGFLFSLIFSDIVTALLSATCIGYAVMLLTYTFVLHRFFPLGKGTSLKFLEWVIKFPSLAFVGFFNTLGLFIHLMLMWRSPLGIQVHGLFWHAPAHDIPALFAFFTILVTTVNFVTSVEVNFYPKYQLYFSLLNEGGSLTDIENAHLEMLTVLRQELYYLAQRQFFVTILAIVVVGEVLDTIGLGFTSNMIGLFRVLCIGYGLYAIANSMMLILLYYADYKDALLSTFTLLIVNTIGTWITIQLPENFYGFGLVFAGLGMYLVAWITLFAYSKRLDYFVLCKQPIFIEEKDNFILRFIYALDQRAE